MRAVAFALVAALVLAAAPAAKKAPQPRLRGAMDVAVDRDGSLLIGDQSDRVLRFRRGRLSVAAKVVFPVEVAIHPRGGFAVLNNETRIRLVDARGRVTTIARGLALVTALAYDRAGNLYISELMTPSGPGRVRRIDAATGGLTTVLATGLDRPHGLVVAGGTVYVCDTFHNRLVAIDLASGAARTAAANLNMPVDVERAPDGTIYIADYGNNRLARLQGDTAVTVARLIGPNGVAVNAAGRVFVTERIFPRVRSVDPATGLVRTVVGGL
jgi:serine/threonine protein kinase, bacterial